MLKICLVYFAALTQCNKNGLCQANWLIIFLMLHSRVSGDHKLFQVPLSGGLPGFDWHIGHDEVLVPLRASHQPSASFPDLSVSMPQVCICLLQVAGKHERWQAQAAMHIDKSFTGLVIS